MVKIAHDIDALVADGRAVEERLYNRLGTKSARDLDVDACVVISEMIDALERQQAVVEAAREKFERMIQVRAGHGMLEGREALDEMARLAGEALAALDAPPEGDG